MKLNTTQMRSLSKVISQRINDARSAHYKATAARMKDSDLFKRFQDLVRLTREIEADIESINRQAKEHGVRFMFDDITSWVSADESSPTSRYVSQADVLDKLVVEGIDGVFDGVEPFIARFVDQFVKQKS